MGYHKILFTQDLTAVSVKKVFGVDKDKLSNSYLERNDPDSAVL